MFAEVVGGWLISWLKRVLCLLLRRLPDDFHSTLTHIHVDLELRGGCLVNWVTNCVHSRLNGIIYEHLRTPSSYFIFVLKASISDADNDTWFMARWCSTPDREYEFIIIGSTFVEARIIGILFNALSCKNFYSPESKSNVTSGKGLKSCLIWKSIIEDFFAMWNSLNMFGQIMEWILTEASRLNRVNHSAFRGKSTTQPSVFNWLILSYYF